MKLRVGLLTSSPITKSFKEAEGEIPRTIVECNLDSVRAGWEKYGCSILPGGWSDRKKRSLINILVSSPLGAHFLRAVNSAKMGKRTTVEFLYKHIREAVLEVRAKPPRPSLGPLESSL